MSQIPDINDNELWIAETTLQERYGIEHSSFTLTMNNTVQGDEYNDMAQCLVSVLQTQSDHMRKLKDSVES